MTANNGTARLVIADDHALVRSGLRNVLAGEPGLEIVGEAANGREAVEICRELCPDLVLMDVRMPEMDGLEATHAVKHECPDTSVLMVTLYEDQNYLYEALKAGAAGYVLKDASEEVLISAVRQALGGESPLHPALAAGLLRRLVDENRQPKSFPFTPEKREEPLPEPLTAREQEILQLLVEGRTNREIAKVLSISPGTVKVHVQHIIAKLEVSDRTQAAVKAIELGLVELQQ